MIILMNTIKDSRIFLGSRGGYGSSDSDRSPSPNRRSRVSPDDSSESDSSSSRSRCTVLVKYLPGRCSGKCFSIFLNLEVKV